MSAQAWESAEGGSRSVGETGRRRAVSRLDARALPVAASQPHWQAGRNRRFCEGGAAEYARERRRWIEPGPRDGEREEQRGKARGEVRYARVTHCQGAHHSLEAGMISPKSTFQQIGTPGPPARGQHRSRSHDKIPQARIERPAADTMRRIVGSRPGSYPGARAKYRASNPGSALS